jgi:hypothetical protein
MPALEASTLLGAAKNAPTRMKSGPLCFVECTRVLQSDNRVPQKRSGALGKEHQWQQQTIIPLINVHADF